MRWEKGGGGRKKLELPSKNLYEKLIVETEHKM